MLCGHLAAASTPMAPLHFDLGPPVVGLGAHRDIDLPAAEVVLVDATRSVPRDQDGAPTAIQRVEPGRPRVRLQGPHARPEHDQRRDFGVANPAPLLGSEHRPRGIMQPHPGRSVVVARRQGQCRAQGLGERGGLGVGGHHIEKGRGDRPKDAE